MCRGRTDKCYAHHYELFYSKWLKGYRDVKNLKLLEIGTFRGDSLLVWAKYFKSASIIGVTYGTKKDFLSSKKTIFEKMNIKVIWGDQSKMETLKILCSEGPFEIIIDDATHVPEHQIFTFANMWKNCLKEGGIYVIEDLFTSYWNTNFMPHNKDNLENSGTGIGKPPPGNAVEKIKQLIDVLNRFQIGYKNMSIISGDEDICSIEFGLDLVAIRKCSFEEKSVMKRIKPVREEGLFNKVEMKTYMEWARKSNPPH